MRSAEQIQRELDSLEAEYRVSPGQFVGHGITIIKTRIAVLKWVLDSTPRKAVHKQSGKSLYVKGMRQFSAIP